MGNLEIAIENGNKKIAVTPCLEPCPIERGMRIVGGKWTGSILWHLRGKPVRFNDLARQLGGASKKVISQRLREMEKNKLIVRKVETDRPLAVTYEITAMGRAALKFLNKLVEWVGENDL